MSFKKCTYSYSISWSPSSIIIPGSTVLSSPLNKSHSTFISPVYSSLVDESGATTFYGWSSSVFYSSISYLLFSVFSCFVVESPLSFTISCYSFIFVSTDCYSTFISTLPFIFGSSFVFIISYLSLFLATFPDFDFYPIIVAFLSAIILICLKL